jgi:hypothetical protein
LDVSVGFCICFLLICLAVPGRILVAKGYVALQVGPDWPWKEPLTAKDAKNGREGREENRSHELEQ